MSADKKSVKYYMEMNKQGTDNAKIYCKNIRS